MSTPNGPLTKLMLTLAHLSIGVRVSLSEIP